MNVSPDGGGNVELDQTVLYSYPATATFADGVFVQLKAVPASGYRFDNWSGDLSGTTNPTNIVIDGNKEITANFSEVRPRWWLMGGIIAGVVVLVVAIWLAVKSRTI